METRSILDETKPIEKVYNETGVGVGAFLGGPIAAGYFLIENYKNLGKRSVVKKAWGFTVISTIIYFTLAYFIQEIVGLSVIPLTAAAVLVARQIFKREQATDIDAHIQGGGEVHSNWRAAGIGLLFFVGTVGLAAGVMLCLPESNFSPPTPVELVENPAPARSTTASNNNLIQSVVASVETKSYGDAAHIIVYNTFDFSELEIDAIADYFTELDFFDAQNQKYVYLEKILFDYEFSITDASADLTNAATSIKYEKLRADMEAFFKDGKVSVLLMDKELDTVLKRFGEEI